MDVSLASFSVENLESFTDLEGNVCSFQKYLKSHGLFSSQCHLYIRTNAKKVLLVNNGIPGNINMTFKKKNMSAHSECANTVICRSMRNCH